jgi:formylmethanofuran dehydrogenase subunit E
MKKFLDESAGKHDHLCPRQVIGVRTGIIAAKISGLKLPQEDKRLLAILETDGCFADGIEASTGCSIGHRTLKVRDFGKVAATFVDTQTKSAFRVTPKATARYSAIQHSDGATSHWEAMLLGYQRMSDEELLVVDSVRLNISIEKLVSHAGRRVTCDICQEEIINEREIHKDGENICLYCGGENYYQLQKSTSADIPHHIKRQSSSGSKARQKL